MKNKMLVLAIAALCVVGGLAYGFFGYHPFHDGPYYDPYYDPYYAPAYYAPDVEAADVAAGRTTAAHEQRVKERVVYPKGLQQGRTE